MKRVVALGSAVLDHRVWVDRWPPLSGRTQATAYLEDLGGGAAVAAATIARLGGAATFLGVVGDDAAGARVTALLQTHGVDTRHITVCAGARTAASTIAIDPGGDRFIIAYPGDRLRDDEAWPPLSSLEGADAVLVDSRLPRAGAALAAAARRRALPVVMDFDVDTADVWTLARLSTHAIADEDLAERTGGPARLLETLRNAAVWGAVTLGEAGVVHGGGRVPAFPVAARDTTGAGDVFHGAFALALVEGQSTAAALVFASAAAAVRCESARLPDRTAVEDVLAAMTSRRDA